MSDYIESLPSDETPLSDTETILLRDILKSDNSTFKKFFIELREPLLIAMGFFLLSLTQVTEFIARLLPYANSSAMAMLAVKSFVLGLLWFLYKNMKA
jgi:hypothetical protein